MRQLETSTLSNQDISAALLVHTYTADNDREVFVRLFADQVAGNGDYVAYVTIQRLGAGSTYRVIPIATAEAASGVTAIALTTIAIPLKDTDVLKVYLTGLAGDTTTPDIITEVWELIYAGAIPNAAADAAGGLPVSDAGGLDLDTILGRITANVALASICTEARLARLDAAITTRAAASVLGAPAGASIAADVAAVKTDTGNLVTRITATLFSGITSLAEWLGLMAGKQTGDSTARTEIRATGAGSGTYDETKDSPEALRDRGDAAWITATSVTVSDKTGFSLTEDQSGVTIGTVTTNTDMRGTDGANTTVPDAAGTAAALHATTDAAIAVMDAILDKFNTMVVLDGAVYDFTAAALAAAPSDSGLSAAETRAAVGLASANLDTQLGAIAKTGADSDTLETLSDQIDGLAALSGEGAYTGTLTIDDGSTGLEGAVVNARRGGVLKASGTTDENGQITNWVFGAYTYDLAVRLDSYQPGTDTIAVTADGWEKIISLTAISITPPSNPTDCACGWLCLNDDDAPVAGVVIRARPDTDASGTGYAWSGQTRSATSVAVTGMATINLPQGSKWWIRRDSGEEELFTVPSESTSTTVVSVRGGKRDTY